MPEPAEPPDDPGDGAPRARAVRAVADALAAAELDAEHVDDGVWHVMLAGDNKRTVPTVIEVGQHHVSLQTFFMRAPDENEGALYGYLLRRHQRSYVFRFMLTDDGDVLLVGVVPLAAVDAAEVDRLLGQLLATADDAFATALRLGFASYIEREQAWRAKVGAPRNPIS